MRVFSWPRIKELGAPSKNLKTKVVSASTKDIDGQPRHLPRWRIGEMGKSRDRRSMLTVSATQGRSRSPFSNGGGITRVVLELG